MKLRNLTLLCGAMALVLGAAGCGRREEAAKPPEPSPPGPVARLPATPPALPPLTPYGWDEVTVGMEEAEALKHGFARTESSLIPGMDCHFLHAVAHPGVLAMVEEGKISRISVSETSAIKTDKNLSVGSTVAEVRAAYGGDIVQLPHHYEAQPAAYLTAWTLPGKRGIRYEVGHEGKVREIHVGGPAIEYVEGCA